MPVAEQQLGCRPSHETNSQPRFHWRQVLTQQLEPGLFPAMHSAASGTIFHFLLDQGFLWQNRCDPDGLFRTRDKWELSSPKHPSLRQCQALAPPTPCLRPPSPQPSGIAALLEGRDTCGPGRESFLQGESLAPVAERGRKDLADVTSELTSARVQTIGKLKAAMA